MNFQQYEDLARVQPIKVELLVKEEAVPLPFDDPLPFIDGLVVTLHDSVPIARMLSTPKLPLRPRGEFTDGTLGRVVKSSEEWWFVTTQRYNERYFA